MTPVIAVMAAEDAITIAIGGVDIVVRSSDPDFLRLLEARYEGFTLSERSRAAASESKGYEFDVELIPMGDPVHADSDLRVRREGASWVLDRGDFHATWNPASRRGRIRQSANPYSMDSVLRIVHTLELAEAGGLLMHAGSVVRNGKAMLFAGVSGAGKTTITRLAPRDATLLTDEISYVRREAEGYVAYGTPFAGELAKSGENVEAPLAAVYLLVQGPVNRIDDVASEDAAREVLKSVLFFAEDQPLVQRVFHAACDLVERVPVKRLTFQRDARVWELLG
jgi:hypothetical protein